MATFYEMSLDDDRQLPLLPYFAGFLNPLWHAANIDEQKGYAERLGRLTGNKPLLMCIYVYDFGNQRKLSYAGMRRQLEVCEEMIRERSVYGVVILGTCMLDLDWESNKRPVRLAGRARRREDRVTMEATRTHHRVCAAEGMQPEPLWGLPRYHPASPALINASPATGRRVNLAETMTRSRRR